MGRNRKPAKSVTAAPEVASVNIDDVPVFGVKPSAFSSIVASVVKLSPEQQDLLIEQQKMNPFVLMAVGMYGGVAQRQRVFDMLENREAGFFLELTNPTVGGQERAWKIAREYFFNNSLDYLYDKRKKEVEYATRIRENAIASGAFGDIAIAAGAENREQRIKAETDKLFLADFWHWWAGYTYTNTTRTGWAMLNMYLSQVGPNAEIPPTMDFFPNYPHLQGYIPTLNPEIVQALQKEYETQQKALEQAGVPEVITLYRGTHQPRGLPLESFSTDRSIADLFANLADFSDRRRGQGEVRTERIPRKYIFGSWQTIPNWPESEVAGKKEYMVLGTSFYNNQRQTRATSRSASPKFRDLHPEYGNIWNPDTESWVGGVRDGSWT